MKGATLGMHDRLEPGYHRWVVLYVREGRGVDDVRNNFLTAGCETYLVQETENTATSADGMPLRGFFAIIQPTISGLTPIELAVRMYARALLVARDRYAPEVEAAFDSYQFFFGEKAVPVKFASDEESLPAGKWYMGSATWSSSALSMAQISARLAPLGVLALSPGAYGGSDGGQTATFVVSPSPGMSPTIRQMRTALGAEVLYLSIYPVDNIEILEAGDRLIAALQSFAVSTGNAASAVAELGGGVLDLGDQVAKASTTFLDWLPWIAGVAAVGGGLYWLRRAG